VLSETKIKFWNCSNFWAYETVQIALFY